MKKILVKYLYIFLFIFIIYGSKECFSQNYAGITTAGTTSYPYGGLQRIGSYVFTDTSVHSLYSSVIDATNGYGYWGTNGGAPAVVVKVALGSADTAPTEVAKLTLSSSGHINAMVIDPANGYAYIGTSANPGEIYKISLGAGTTAPSIVATLTLNSGEGGINGGAIDTVAGYAYFITNAGLVKVALGSGATAPTRIGTAPTYSGNLGRMVRIDAPNGYVYVASLPFASPTGTIDKFSTDGAGSPSCLGYTVLPQSIIGGFDVDTTSGYGYLATYFASTIICSIENDTTPCVIMKVSLGGSTSTTVNYIGGTNVPEMHFTNIVTDPVSGYIMLGNDVTYPASNIIKVGEGAGNALPTEVGSIQLTVGQSTLSVDTCPAPIGTPLNGEVFIQSGVIDSNNGYTYWGTDTQPGQIIKVRYSEKGVIKGTQIILNQTSVVSTMNFYSQTASGDINLAVYDNSSPNNLLWQSGSMVNTTATNWISVPISSGSPSTLTLPAGTYWLAWQTDSNSDVPSYTAGTSGEGFYFAQSYGDFPDALSSPTLTSETWSEYITYTTTVPVELSEFSI